jgi:hypothetical protein
MNSKTALNAEPVVPVAKRDMVEVWSVLEKLVVSLRKIGSAHAVADGQGKQTPDQRCREIDALDRFLSPELLRELSRARRLLAEYLPNDELEELSEHSIEFWADDKRGV